MYNPIKTFKKIMKTASGKIARDRTCHVIKITLLVYLPLTILITLSIGYMHGFSLLLILLLLLSTFPFSKHIVIPLSEKRKKEIESKYR